VERQAEAITEYLNDSQAREFARTFWWLVSRRPALGVFLDIAARRRPLRILEIGCADGMNFELLSRYGEVSGLERSSVQAARARELGIARDVFESDFPDGRVELNYDLYVLLDVLEHNEDDGAMLRALAGTADHQILVSVPAFQFLFGPFDKSLGHYRRYSSAGLRSLLTSCGYRVVHVNYHVVSLFPLAAAARVVERLSRDRSKVRFSVWLARGLINRALTWITLFEAWLGRYVNYPFGLSIICLAEMNRSESADLTPPSEGSNV
jgi:SAM-dependent methyltransferase